MNEREFNDLAEATLHNIELALENYPDLLEVERGAGGVLEITLPDDSQVIINRHGPAQEIWVASRRGGFHFRPEEGDWRDTRDGTALFTKLADLLTQHTGTPIHLSSATA